MRDKWFVAGGVAVLATLVMLVSTGGADAGFMDKVGGVLKKTGKEISEGVKEAGREVGIIDKKTPATSKLPGGVSSRLKKMHQELDKAEQGLAKGVGSGVDRSNRAQLHLKRARNYRSEIEKRYAGQFSEDHPDVTAAFSRLAELEADVAAVGQDAAADETVRKEAEKAQAEAASQAADEQQAAENGRKRPA